MKNTMFFAAGLCLLAIPVQSAEVFISQSDFESAASVAGTIKLVEDFEESNATGSATPSAVLTPPLLPGITNVDEFSVGFPTGLVADLQVTTNAGGPLNVLGDDYLGLGNSTEVVGTKDWEESIVIEVLSSSGREMAIGLNVFNPFGSGDYDVLVLDEGGSELFAGIVAAGAADGSFIGVIVDDGESIGSIAITSVTEGAATGAMTDNIQLWSRDDATPTQESTWSEFKVLFR